MDKFPATWPGTFYQLSRKMPSAALKPSTQHHSSRVFWVVITMQSGITRILIGIPSKNPASSRHSLRRNIA